MRARLLFLLRTYVVTVLLFMVAKVVFMLCNSRGHGVTAADYVQVIGHGLTLDLSTALYILIIPFFVALASVWVRVPQWVLRIYFGVVAVALALAFVADTSLYAFWGFKLDASCLQYLEQPEGMTQSVSRGYLLLRLLAIIIVAIGVFMAYTFRRRKPRRNNKSSRRRYLPTAIAETVFYVLMVPLMVIGIRGGVHESTTNIGQAYFSQNQFLNHAAVNPVFSFLYSLSHQMGDTTDYDFFDEATCEQLIANVYTTESLLTDTLLTTPRPDIVVILMESAGEVFASAMPHLQQLKQEGINFSRCYANSWRTDRGTVCALSGYPSFPTLSVMKMPEKSRTLPALARTLQADGYQTSYIYGGDINFTNMRSYLISTGWEHLTSMDDFTASERRSAQWGVRDDITFAALFREITGESGKSGESGVSGEPGQHHLWGFSTLSSHEPWDVPLQRHPDAMLNAFAYLDDCLGTFVDSLRKSPRWDNLLIVLTADHGINYQHIDQSRPLEKNHIPMLWIGGAVRAPRTIDVLCNQSDLCATLLGQMGLPHADFTFSRDVLSATYSYPTAVHNYHNAQWIADSTGHVLYDFDAHRYLVNQSADSVRLLQVSKAILQTTLTNLKQR